MVMALKYGLFAALATLANILSQDLSIRLYHGPYDLLLSIFIGTLVGLVVKYVLDKKYIFSYQLSGLLENGKKFFLYSLMGIITTLVVWGSELGFHLAFGTKSMRYLGAILGLGVGYWLKYRLDHRFVFREAGCT